LFSGGSGVEIDDGCFGMVFWGGMGDDCYFGDDGCFGVVVVLR
jgi:hypothetical protein